jgi:hypothetical protein
MQQSDDMTERLLSLFQNREFELSEAGRFAADQDAMAADEERAKHREAATTWRRSLGAGDTVPGHDAYDYEAMARDEVWPKPDGAGRVPLSPRYWKPGRMVLAGYDLATGRRILSSAPLEERLLSGQIDTEPDAEDIDEILSQATPEDFAELAPAERRSLEAWMESQGVVLAQGGTQGTASDAPPVARVGRMSVPYRKPSTRDFVEPAVALMDALAGVLRGGVAQTLGLPGDVESLVRMLTGGDNVMPTTEDMNAKLPPVVPPSTTDLVTGKNPREFSADFGQAVGEIGGLGKAPGAAVDAVKTAVKAAKKRRAKIRKESDGSWTIEQEE